MGFEIEKLRSRLRNVKKGVTEYRMTVDEAKRLLDEFDTEQKVIEVAKPATKEIVKTNILDGGTF